MKKFWSNAYVVGTVTSTLGTLIPTVLVKIYKDFTLAASFHVVWDWLAGFKFVPLILGTILAIAVVRLFSKRQKSEERSVVEKPTFQSLSLRGFQWQWEWSWNNNHKFWEPINVRVRCPKCADLMIYHPVRSWLHGASIECPYCGHFVNNALETRVPEQHEVLTVIRDKINAERR